MMPLFIGMVLGAALVVASIFLLRWIQEVLRRRRQFKEKKVVEQTLRLWNLEIIVGEPLNESRRRIRRAIKGQAPWDAQSTGKRFEATKTVLDKRPDDLDDEEEEDI